MPGRRCFVVLLVLLAALPLRAQQERWQQLNDQVKRFSAQGRYREAIAAGEEAVGVAEATFGADAVETATSLNNLAFLYWNLGHYAEAEPLFLRALSIDEKALGPERPAVGMLLNNLGTLYQEQGRYAEAEPLDERALRIFENAPGGEGRALTASLTVLALLYRAEGRYAEAEPLLQRALRIDEKVSGPEHPDVAGDLNNLGALFGDQGRYAEAEPLYQRALGIREKALGPAHPEVANTLSNLADLYTRQGRYAEAEPLLQRALRIWEDALGAEHPYLAATLNNLSALYFQQSRYAEAEPILQRSLQLEEKALGPEHPNVAADLSNLAVLYAQQGRYAEAEPLSQRALRIREKALGPEHPQVARSLNELAVLQFAQDKPAAAQPLFARSLDILFSRFQYSFTYMSEKERLQLLATVAGDFPRYFSFCVSYAGAMPALRGSLYDVLLWEKGFVGQSMAALRSKIAAAGDPEALKLLDRLTALKQQLATLLNNPGPDHEAWQKQVAELQEQANQIEQQLVRRSAALAEDRKLERATWRDVQKALKPGEAAVEVVRFPFFDGKKWTEGSKYVALVVTPETQGQPQLIVIGDAGQLEGAPVRLYHDQVGSSRGTEPEEAPEQPGAASLYHSFWERLEPALAGAKRVYLSTDGVLNQVSVGLLRTPEGKLLLQKYDLRLVSSTKELLRASAPATSREAVLVGNPKFLLTAEQYRAALEELQKPGAAGGPVKVAAAGFSAAGAARSRDLKTRGGCAPPPPEGGILCPLAGTAAELDSVSSLLKGRRWQVAAYREAAALEEAVKAVHHPRLLHLATHGFFESDQQMKQRERAMGSGQEQPSGMEDPMLRSGLLFAGADLAVQGQPPAGDFDDGVLTAYEASTLDLQGTELVVLSACETGLGEVQAGEGVFGLRRALEIAGAQSVMMTLWSVPDKETQELMTLFYTRWLSGTEKHEALRQAQLAEREVVRKRYGRDLPYYWGAFVLVGK